ncbi:unnamed protein product, partial [marine sediment metagenome]
TLFKVQNFLNVVKMEDLEKKLFEQSWTFKNREKIIQKMHSSQYDVVIIGAGITGAGIAREAAMRNLSVAIVDMQDFGAGTSSRSTKLAHLPNHLDNRYQLFLQVCTFYSSE